MTGSKTSIIIIIIMKKKTNNNDNNNTNYNNDNDNNNDARSCHAGSHHAVAPDRATRSGMFTVTACAKGVG